MLDKEVNITPGQKVTYMYFNCGWTEIYEYLFTTSLKEVMIQNIFIYMGLVTLN